MLCYILYVNRLVILFTFAAISVAIAQDAAPPLPDTTTGWGDLFLKSSPFLIGAMNIYLPDLMRMYLPKLFGGMSLTALKLIGAFVTIATSGLNSYIAQIASDGIGGVQPDVAMVGTATTNLVVAGGRLAQKAGE